MENGDKLNKAKKVHVGKKVNGNWNGKHWSNPEQEQREIKGIREGELQNATIYFKTYKILIEEWVNIPKIFWFIIFYYGQIQVALLNYLNFLTSYLNCCAKMHINI